MMNNQKAVVREQIKKLAKEVTLQKQILKKLTRQRQQSVLEHWRVDHLSEEYRHKHIAYSLLRGRSRAQIERLVDENNLADEYEVKRYISEFSQHFPKAMVAKALKELATPVTVKMTLVEPTLENNYEAYESKPTFFENLKWRFFEFINKFV